MSTIGVPIKLLHEAQGHIITLELKTGQLYRGKLLAGNLTKINNIEHGPPPLTPLSPFSHSFFLHSSRGQHEHSNERDHRDFA